MTSPAMNNPLEKPLTVGDWLITFILLSIPFVGLIFLLYWALASSSNVNRKNFCIAYIIVCLFFFAIVLVLLFMGVLAGLLGEYAPALHSA